MAVFRASVGMVLLALLAADLTGPAFGSQMLPAESRTTLRKRPPVAGASTGNPTQDAAMEYRVRAAIAEREYEDMREAADELVHLGAEVARRLDTQNSVGEEDRKTLERIRKLAKKVRAVMGGGGDPTMAEPPKSLRDAAAALGERSKLIAESMKRFSRFEVNARLVELTTEVMFLIDTLKAFGAR